MLRANGKALIEAGKAYDTAARDLVTTIIGWELIANLDLPQNIRAAVEAAKAKRQAWMDVPLYVESGE